MIKNKKKAILIIVGFVLFVIFYVIFLFILLNNCSKDVSLVDNSSEISLEKIEVPEDTSLIDDSDISLEKIEVPDEQNAYFDLLKLEDVIYYPEERTGDIIDMVEGENWDEELALEIIENNIEAFAIFAEAANKPSFQNPSLIDPENISPITYLTPPHILWRKMTRLSAIRARYLAKQGRGMEAIEEALSSVRIGQKIQESQLSCLEHAVATRIKETGLETVQAITPSLNLSNEEFLYYIEELNSFYNNEEGLISCFKGEYHSSVWLIDGMVSGDKDVLEWAYGEEGKNIDTEKLKNNYYFNPNETKLILAEYIRFSIENIDKTYSEIKKNEKQNSATSNLSESDSGENAMGRVMMDVTINTLSSYVKIKHKEDLLVAATQTIIAIKFYKTNTGDYPATLDNLVPEYLESVPFDPFDGEALRYSIEDKIIYSVGEDLVDSGGNLEDNDLNDMNDPTFKIAF